MADSSSDLLQINSELRHRLEALLRQQRSTVQQPVTEYDVVLTCCEVNYRHGTGVLVHRIFGDSPNIISVRSYDLYEGEHILGDVRILLPFVDDDRIAMFQTMARLLQGYCIKRLICIPYAPHDYLAALAIKELFNVPLCAYIMDEQNIAVNKVPDSLMEEFLAKSSVRFAISQEMRDAYELKFGYKFHWLPPVVPDALIQTKVHVPAIEYARTRRGILVGNLWGQSWLEALKTTLKGANLKVDWYGNTKAGWLSYTLDELISCGITAKGLLPEADLAPLMRDYPYAMIPSGSLDEFDDNYAVSKFSLPSRMVYILAASGTPMIVLGNPDTVAAKFVKKFKLGTVCNYTPESFLAAVEYVSQPQVQQELRENAAKVASLFSVGGIERWIWQSLEQGMAADMRFDDLIPRREGGLVPHIDLSVPKFIWREHVEIYQALRRLKREGFQPDFVVDVGASTGFWSNTVNYLFPDARFILAEPLLSQYASNPSKYGLTQHPNFEFVEVAVSNYIGSATFQVSSDLYGSSLMQPSDFRTYRPIDVTVTTLDQLAQDRNIQGRGLLKVDVQFAEHLVLEGARNFLDQVDVLILELALLRYDESSKLFHEMLHYVHDLGFRYYDDLGGWRLPEYGTLLQKDTMFVRCDRFLPRMG